MAEAARVGNGGQVSNNLDYWLGAVETENGWAWMSGGPMTWTGGWWGEGPDGEGMGPLKGGCIQLGRNMRTQPATLDTFYWARANTNKECTSNDNDNGIICEMEGGI